MKLVKPAPLRPVERGGEAPVALTARRPSRHDSPGVSLSPSCPSPVEAATIHAASRPDPFWEPLRLRLFRFFWIASFASNLGTWIHEVGAGWLMTTLDGSPEMVAAVRTSMSLPILVLAIPAGVLADRFDKRRLLMMTQSLLMLVTATLAVLTWSGHITAWGLLGLTFIMGLAMVVQVPTWQSAIPELVPRHQISRAVGLGSISFNLARTLGPAIGGVLIALVGLWSTFAINACTFAGVVVVLFLWKRTARESSRGRSFAASLRQGVRYVAMHRVMRNVMVSVVLFVLPGSSLWSLLPLFAKTELGWGSGGFGIMVACVGAGAVTGAALLPRIRHRFGSDRLVVVAMLMFATGLFVMSRSPRWEVLLPAILVMGAGWMATLTTLNATAQITLPPRLRARGMGCYLTMMAGSMATGSMLWGQIAGRVGLGGAFQSAALLMVATALGGLAFPLATRLDD